MSDNERGSFFTRRQHIVINVTAIMKGGNIILKNSVVGILKYE